LSPVPKTPSSEMITLLRQWWKARQGFDAHTTPLQERWRSPGRKRGTPMGTRQLSFATHLLERGTDWRRKETVDPVT
jgi:hypothetical protein